MTPTPLDDVAFLARSDHRVEVLRTLASEPRTRPALHEETEIPQPTLGRILGGFEDRHWIEREGRTYALTPFGGLVAAEFEELLDTVATVQRLGGVLELLPTEQMDIDVRAFADATVVTPETGDVFRHVRRAEDRFMEADHTLFLSNTVGVSLPDERREQLAEFMDSDKVAESVLSAETLQQGMPDTESKQLIREGIESGQVQTYVYDGSIPFVLAVADDTVLLSPTDDHGIPAALIETDDERVQAWARELFEEYRAQSTPVTADDRPA